LVDLSPADVLLEPDSPFLALARSLDELVFVWRASGEMLWVNESFVRVTGMTCEDFAFRNADNPFIHPDDLPHVLKHIGAFLDSDARQSQPVENRFCDAWGRFHALSSVLHKVSWMGQPALLLVSRRQGVSPREANAAQEAQRRLMESLGDGVLWLSADGRIVFSNRVFQAWLGVRAVELAKQPLVELLQPADQPRAALAFQSIARGEANARFSAALHALERELDITLCRIDGEEHTPVLAIARDTTDLKQLERSLQRAQRLESIGRLAGGVAHDFNNSLTTIAGNLSLALLDVGQDPHVRELLSDAQRAAHAASTLTKQLLAFSRKQVIAPQVLSLNDAVQQLQRMLQRLLGEDIELDVRLAPELLPICIDFGQLEQMLVNLCANARDAMPRGGKLIVATDYASEEDGLRARHPELATGRLVRLTVSDIGHGIADDVREHIFEPFFTTKDATRGTGLGLAMVYGAVQQNGGCIEVESAPGHGTTFTLCFPAVHTRAQPLTAAPMLEAPGGSESVVLVEDEEMVRTFAVRLLQRLGYDVVAFASGAEALRALATRTEPIHLLITDIVMPGMNGRALAERAREHWPNLEVLFTSGYSEQLIERHGVLDAGIDFLPKPYTIRSLAEHVRKLLDRAR